MPSSKQFIVDLLVRREGGVISELEAESWYDEVASCIQEAVEAGTCDPEDVLREEMGLEPDYISHFLPFA